MKAMRKTKTAQTLLLIACLITLPMFADDVPADFGDALGDNANDAPISNYFWMGMITILGVVYLVKRKYFKKA